MREIYNGVVRVDSVIILRNDSFLNNLFIYKGGGWVYDVTSTHWRLALSKKYVHSSVYLCRVQF